ncbi:Mitochondrial oxaloacetate carrier protein [Chytridiales sp. JEL 0842]|nr:Mitochondrial oxaloacetate carrier protein [Chytridiales sp. JEL 0842]
MTSPHDDQEISFTPITNPFKDLHQHQHQKEEQEEEVPTTPLSFRLVNDPHFHDDVFDDLHPASPVANNTFSIDSVHGTPTRKRKAGRGLYEDEDEDGDVFSEGWDGQTAQAEGFFGGMRDDDGDWFDDVFEGFERENHNEEEEDIFHTNDSEPHQQLIIFPAEPTTFNDIPDVSQTENDNDNPDLHLLLHQPPHGEPLTLTTDSLPHLLSTSTLAQMPQRIITLHTHPPAEPSLQGVTRHQDPEWVRGKILRALKGVEEAGGRGERAVLKVLARGRKGGGFKFVRLGLTRFACMKKVMEMACELLRENKVATKRELYYRHVGLFGNQAVVDQIVEDLAATLGIPRACLNIVAASKGLVAGALKLQLTDGQVIDCMQGGGSTRGVLIPTSEEIVGIETTARFVLVIEKEATFHGLIDAGFLKGPLAPCVLMTGKGYPDVNTRRLLKRLSEMDAPWIEDFVEFKKHKLAAHEDDQFHVFSDDQFHVDNDQFDVFSDDDYDEDGLVGARVPGDGSSQVLQLHDENEIGFVPVHSPSLIFEEAEEEEEMDRRLVVPSLPSTRKVKKIPCFGLFDCDGHGIDIMLCYKHGSMSMAFESANLATPRLVWLGLKPSDQVPVEQMVRLTLNDRKKLYSLLKRFQNSVKSGDNSGVKSGIGVNSGDKSSVKSDSEDKEEMGLYRRQVGRLLRMNAKWEIQAVGSVQLAHDIYRNLIHTARTIYTEKGLTGLYTPGLLATCIRELSYSSFRFGLYPPVKSALTKVLFIPPDHNHNHNLNHNLNQETLKVPAKGAEPLILKVAAGVVSGALGSALANPTDVVKIKLQGEAGRLDRNGIYQTGLNKGLPPTYRNTFHAFIQIARDEGVIRGLFKGVQATAIRASLLTGTQLSSYDETKYLLKKYGILSEGILLHTIGSIVAGLVTTTVVAPSDIIKTRLLNQSSIALKGTHAATHYTGFIDCFVKIVQQEGPSVLLRGWVPSYLRIAPHFVVAIPLFEQLRVLAGLSSL